MTQLIKIQALTADELLNEFELTEPEAEKVLVRDTAPQISIEHLIKSEYYADAIKLLAHGLPKREAVWWACLAARKALTPDTDEDNINALLAMETWARKPNAGPNSLNPETKSNLRHPRSLSPEPENQKLAPTI